MNPTTPLSAPTNHRPSRKLSAAVWLGVLSVLSTLTSVAVPAEPPAAFTPLYSPPEWQTAICLPDDPRKSLVDRSGELLYHYSQGGREFGTRVSVETTPGATWTRQELLSPRVPIVRTYRRADDLQILQESFAVTDSRPAAQPSSPLRRLDDGPVQRNWAQPPAGSDPRLRHIALHNNGSLHFQLAVKTGDSSQIAMVLCEGYWNQPGKRVQILRVEGAEPRTIDTVADLGQNRPGAFHFSGTDLDRNGTIDIEVQAAPEAADKNTILNALWAFPEAAHVSADSILAGTVNDPRASRFSLVGSTAPGREDLLLVQVTNSGQSPRTLHPKLIVDTALLYTTDFAAGRLTVNSEDTVSASLPILASAQEGASRHVLQLGPLDVPAGQTRAYFVRYSSGATHRDKPLSLKQAFASRERAVRYWQKAPLPFGRIAVPDPGIQALLDSAIRNIWQAREIKQGLPAFQVGPTCYRGLWIVDGAFLLESAAILGAGHQARNGVAYELTFQKPDGRIEVMKDFSKENGIVLWTCVRHAQLTQDKAWLDQRFPQLLRVAEHIRALRQQTLTNSSPVDDGLLPAGFSDGGVGGINDEYTNPYWNLTGLRSFIQAATWLGKEDVARQWQGEYDDFLAAFRRAAARDLKKDPHGNAYVPTRMDGQDLPQRGQWAFCQAVYPGQIFSREDPLVASTLAMLAATEREGMVYGTGWDATGIWNYFASFYGHAWLWQGNGPKAAQALQAFANHAAPTLVWREEQSLKGEPFKKVGDMPHNWASAEFVRLTVHLLALDRGNELHLLEGMPREWLAPGSVTRLNGIATPFGPLSLQVKVDAQGRTAAFSVKPLARNCEKVIVHLPSGGTESLNPRKHNEITLQIPPNPQR